ncbi:UNVERIFIED_CONTAM: hypothetical protein Sindi_1326800 [Sesamum indicum]
MISKDGSIKVDFDEPILISGRDKFRGFISRRRREEQVTKSYNPKLAELSNSRACETFSHQRLIAAGVHKKTTSIHGIKVVTVSTEPTFFIAMQKEMIKDEDESKPKPVWPRDTSNKLCLVLSCGCLHTGQKSATSTLRRTRLDSVGTALQQAFQEMTMMIIARRDYLNFFRKQTQLKGQTEQTFYLILNSPT